VSKTKSPITYLLDVNVLIALVDSAHVQHDAAHDWFETVGCNAWATCPFTEAGLLRILSNSSYPNAVSTPFAAAMLLQKLQAHPGHVNWAANISMLDERITPARLLHSRQVTDTYLLALAQAHGGKLATFDRRLVTDAVKNGDQVLVAI
jgi:uncharacterized protein